ncbi:hypothetical protein [Nostoc sp. CHAB 5715]|uniref:hypothetical protein n=1 Tax=Nostoc sp. CHAB 5715 TaxID=2780400 RepID=UPI001E366E54|nr:hypothetical protein [Nostoc sp. CHAB 5715]MCC5621976.1 hypothetical protein [Nostoc sp. CHAB 5715]
MTNTPNNLEDIKNLAIYNTQAIAALTNKIDDLTTNVNELTTDVNRVLARSAVLDDVILELQESQEQNQRSFEQYRQDFLEHQQTTNAALNSLEAILLQLIRIFPQQ